MCSVLLYNFSHKMDMTLTYNKRHSITHSLLQVIASCKVRVMWDDFW
jgi:hypothetical protein